MGCPTEVYIGDNLVFSICTHDPDTGVLTDADAAPSYRVYEDETGVAILTGTMAKLDDAGTTGFYTEQIACTAANGFEDRRSYTIYVQATVDTDTGGISYGFRATDGAILVDNAITATKIAADAITSSELALSAAQEIADEILKRGIDNVEDTADTLSLAAIVLATLESSISGSTWTIRKSDGTTFTTKTVGVDANADPIVSVT